LQKRSKPELQEKGICDYCGTIEDIKHILTNCVFSGQELTWNLAATAWPLTGEEWFYPSVGNIPSSGLNPYTNDSGKQNKGLNHLCTIILSESAYLIWKICCEWHIGQGRNQEKLHHSKEIKNRWFPTMYHRLQLDKLSVDTKYRNKHSALRKNALINPCKYLISPDNIWTIDNQHFMGF